MEHTLKYILILLIIVVFYYLINCNNNGFSIGGSEYKCQEYIQGIILDCCTKNGELTKNNCDDGFPYYCDTNCSKSLNNFKNNCSNTKLSDFDIKESKEIYNNIITKSCKNTPTPTPPIHIPVDGNKGIMGFEFGSFINIRFSSDKDSTETKFLIDTGDKYCMHPNYNSIKKYYENSDPQPKLKEIPGGWGGNCYEISANNVSIKDSNGIYIEINEFKFLAYVPNTGTSNQALQKGIGSFGFDYRNSTYHGVNFLEYNLFNHIPNINYVEFNLYNETMRSDCLKYKDQASCDSDTECAWCTSISPSLPAACNTLVNAKGLPSVLFTCKKVALDMTGHGRTVSSLLDRPALETVFHNDEIVLYTDIPDNYEKYKTINKSNYNNFINIDSLTIGKCTITQNIPFLIDSGGNAPFIDDQTENNQNIVFTKKKCQNKSCPSNIQSWWSGIEKIECIKNNINIKIKDNTYILDKKEEEERDYFLIDSNRNKNFNRDYGSSLSINSGYIFFKYNLVIYEKKEKADDLNNIWIKEK